jgi:hypothetical protein
VDDITVDTPCLLHIPLGRVGNKTKDVAIGVVMPRRVFHNNSIPAEYAKVLIREITDMGDTDYPPESILMSPRGGRGEQVILKFNKTHIGIRTIKTGQSDLVNRTFRFCQRVKHKTYSIYFQALYK